MDVHHRMLPDAGVQIEDCVNVGECPMRWVALGETPTVGLSMRARQCGTCSRLVAHCESVEQLGVAVEHGWLDSVCSTNNC